MKNFGRPPVTGCLSSGLIFLEFMLVYVHVFIGVESGKVLGL